MLFGGVINLLCGWFGRALRTPPLDSLPSVALPRSYKYGAFAPNQLRWFDQVLPNHTPNPAQGGVWCMVGVAGIEPATPTMST